VESIGGIATMHSRVGERFDYLVKLDYRARPFVRHNERCSVGMRRSDVDKVDPEAVNFGLELWKPVEERLSRAPIVFLKPVGCHRLHISQRQPLRPVIDAFALGPSRRTKAPLEIFELLIRRGNSKKYNLVASSDTSAPNKFPAIAGPEEALQINASSRDCRT
jgi:hypothetical protein